MEMAVALMPEPRAIVTTHRQAERPGDVDAQGVQTVGRTLHLGDEPVALVTNAEDAGEVALDAPARNAENTMNTR